MKKSDILELIQEYHKQKGFYRNFFTKIPVVNYFGTSFAIDELQAFLDHHLLHADNEYILDIEDLSALNNLLTKHLNKNQDILSSDLFKTLKEKIKIDLNNLFALNSQEKQPFGLSAIDEKDYKEEEINGIFFRGDDRPPQVVFVEGAQPLIKADIFQFVTKETRVIPSGSKNLVATSRSLSKAAFFPCNDKEKSFIYIVVIRKGFNIHAHTFKHLTDDLIKKGLLTYLFSHEVACSGIPPADILGALEIRRKNLLNADSSPEILAQLSLNQALGNFSIERILWNPHSFIYTEGLENSKEFQLLKEVMHAYVDDNKKGIKEASTIGTIGNSYHTHDENFRKDNLPKESLFHTHNLKRFSYAETLQITSRPRLNKMRDHE